MFVAHTHTRMIIAHALQYIIYYTAEGFAISNTLHNKNKLFSTCMIPHVVSVDNTIRITFTWPSGITSWASGFGGMEWWNGMVEWTTGMEYWNTPPTTAPF